MTRTLSSAVNSYLSEPVIDFRVLAHLTFANTTMRVATGLGPLWVGSDDYLGVGHLGGVEKVSEDAGSFASKIKMTLTAVDSVVLGDALAESLFGKRVRLYRCWLREGTVVNTAELWYQGYMGELNIFRGDPERGNYFEVTCETRLNRKSKVSYYTAEDLMTAGYSGDLFFSYTPIIPKIKSTWGNRQVYFDVPGVKDDLFRVFQGVVDSFFD